MDSPWLDSRKPCCNLRLRAMFELLLLLLPLLPLLLQALHLH